MKEHAKSPSLCIALILFFTVNAFSAETAVSASAESENERLQHALQNISEAKEKAFSKEGRDFNSSLQAPIDELKKSIRSAKDVSNIYQSKIDKLHNWYYGLYAAGGVVTVVGAIASTAVTAGIGGVIAVSTGLYNTIRDEKDVKWNNVTTTCRAVIPVENRLDALCSSVHTQGTYSADYREYEQIHKQAWEVIPACKIAAAAAGNR
jgi:hypothetical protein